MSKRPPDEGQREDLQWRVLDALQKRHNTRRTGDSPRRVKALVLARACGIRPHGSDDSRKKGLRNVIRALRQSGVQIASDLKAGGGYWLPTDASDHAQYRDFLHRQGGARLATEARSKRSPAVAEDGGQLAMFGTAPSSDNLAMVH